MLPELYLQVVMLHTTKPQIYVNKQETEKTIRHHL